MTICDLVQKFNNFKPIGVLFWNVVLSHKLIKQQNLSRFTGLELQKMLKDY